MEHSKEKREIYLAGGCFWGVEKYFKSIPGVIETDVGYANGRTKNPTYEEVCQQNTGHAECVRVVYDPNVLRLSKILDFYFVIIDPTSINRQGNDIGPQYRTGIYYVHREDEGTIKNAINELQKKYRDPIAIEVEPLTNYYRAEEYHQNYLEKNPGGYCHIGQEHFDWIAKQF